MPKDKLSQDDYDKAVGQFRLGLNDDTFKPFRCYGLDIYIPEVISQITDKALRLHRRLNGEDIQI